jgi:hypothetical protein
MNTDTIDAPGITTVDFGQTLDAMIAAGKYDRKDDAITADKFPVEGSGIKKFRNKLFHFDRYISSKGAVSAMRKEKFTPATHVHGLTLGATFPDMQRKYPIACLGSSAWVTDYRFVVYLYGDFAQRNLHLRHWDVDWDGHWRLLGVQEVSGA